MAYVPDRDEFVRMAADATIIPVYREVIADADTPVSALAKLGLSPPAFLLESVTGGETLGRYSFLGRSARLTFASRGREVVVADSTGKERRETASDPLAQLERLLSRFRPARVPGLPRFCGGAVGYIGFEVAASGDAGTAGEDFASVGRGSEAVEDVPDMYFFIVDEVLIFDHVRRTLQVVVHASPGPDPAVAYDDACRRIDAVIRRLQSEARLRPLGAPQNGAARTVPGDLLAKIAHDSAAAEFCAAAEAARQSVLDGHVFQVVLSRRFDVPLRAHPFDLYRVLRSVNPSPYMFYLDFGDVQLVGASPELLVRLEDGVASVRPIAGTRRRGAGAADDERLAAELLADEKEAAEHVMLVDLAIDDLSKVCEPGTVRVSRRMAVEKYSHVMHIVSDVEGRLAPGRTAFDLLRAAFPAGTVSGAPKRRAMELIRRLEPTRRGPYAGAVAYCAFSGNMDSCIAIRTIVVQRGTARIQAGAGIVADSEPRRELAEIVAKAEALLQTIALADGVSI